MLTFVRTSVAALDEKISALAAAHGGAGGEGAGMSTSKDDGGSLAKKANAAKNNLIRRRATVLLQRSWAIQRARRRLMATIQKASAASPAVASQTQREQPAGPMVAPQPAPSCS